MANPTSVFVVFSKPGVQLGANGLGGAANALNSVQQLPDGRINTTDTVIGTATTAQSVFAIVNTTSKLIPLAGVALGGISAASAVVNINNNLNEQKPVAVSDIAALASGLSGVGAGFVVIALGASAPILVPIALIGAAAGAIQYSASGYEYNTVTRSFDLKPVTVAQNAYLNSLAQSTRFAPDGVTPLNVNFSATNGNNRIDTTWTKDNSTGNYFKYETVSTLRSDGSTLSSQQTQYKYNSDGLPLSGVSNAIDGTGRVTGGANLAIGPDGKTWVTVGGSAPVITSGTPTPPSTPIPTLEIQTDGIPNSDRLTVTSTINNQTGAVSAVLRDGSGTPVLSAGPDQTMVRDPATGVFTVTNTATQSKEIFDPITGNRLYVQANGSGVLETPGVDASGFPSQIRFEAGGLTTNANGSVTITPAPNSDGTSTPAVTLFNPADTYSVASGNSGGSTSFAVSNRAGILQSTATQQTFDDGTQLVTVNYPSGFQTIISTDTLGGSRQVEYSVPGDLNIRAITDRNAQGQVTSTQNISVYIEDDPRSDNFNRVIPNSYNIVNTDGDGTITATGLRTVNPTDSSYTDNILGSVTPDNPAGSYGQYATDANGITRPVVQQTALNNLSQSASAFNNAYALIQALQNNQPLPALAAGIRLYNNISPGTLTPQLTGVASAITALTSLMSLDAALARGDYAQAFASGASAFTFGVEAFNQIVYRVASDSFRETFGGVIGAGNFVGEYLPYINIANSLIRGDIGGAAGGVAGIMVSSAIATAAAGAAAGTTLAALGAAAGPIGAIAGMVIGTILSSLLEDDPRPFIPTELWSQTGTASVYLNGAGALDITASGESYPRNAATAQLGSLVNSLNNIVINHNAGDPINLLALVPQRLTSVGATVGGFVGAPDTTNLNFFVNSVNPATGQSLNPDLYFGTNGSGASQTFNPERPELYFGTTINAYYTQEALSRQAIAPLWEAQTARIQANNLLSNAGLSELERAANLGRLAGPDAPAAAGTYENWNPIGMNFGGGLAVSTLASMNSTSSSTEFNIDGIADLNARLLGTANPQYQHKTQWLNSTDGYLVLDKNINGTIDNAEELFSNTKVAEPFRGMASLGNWDADGNGLINNTDPLYNQLFVWKDANADGQTQSAEVTNLSGLGITSLDYDNGIFTQAGQTRQMSTLSLKAETIGRSYVQKPDGIQINTNAGQSTLRVTQLHDLNNLQPNADGFTTEQGVPAIISVRGNGLTGASAIQGLLDNDRVSNAPNALLTVAGVGNAYYYENRSCLRPYLLGYRPKIHMKADQKCSKQAFSTGENRLRVNKQADSGRESSHSRLFTCASSYEMCSIFECQGVVT